MRAKVVRRHTCHYPRRESRGAPGDLGWVLALMGSAVDLSAVCTGGLAVAVKQGCG